MSMQTNFIERTNAYGESYRMSYSSWGNPEAEKTLLCLHGLNRNSRDFDYIAEYFSNSDYYIIAPDLPGRGNSGYLQDGRGYNLESTVTDLAQLIAQLELKNIDCIGTSLGGAMGMILASMPQNKFNKLILNDIGAEVELAGIVRIATYSGEDLDFGTFTEACNYYQQYCLNDGIYDDNVWLHMFRSSFQKNQNHRWELKRDRKIASSLAEGMLGNGNIDLWEYWKRINQPVFIIHGVNSDLLLDATISKMQHIHPNTSVLTINDAGHSPYLYRQEHLKRIAQFLMS